MHRQLKSYLFINLNDMFLKNKKLSRKIKMDKLTKESDKQSHLKHGNATNTQKQPQ